VKLEEFLRRGQAAQAAVDEQLRRLQTYSVGDYVWARWGNSKGVQLAQVVDAHPASHHGVAEWFRVRIYHRSRGRWQDANTERRILRALTPSEIRQHRDLGVIREVGT
jgi:hypothetical protein